MKIRECKNAPQWLKEADTLNADVAVSDDGYVIWRGGMFRGGMFRGGMFRGGMFRGGMFRGGVFRGGVFRGGVFRGGVFSDGEFSGGVFSDGEFSGGVFSDGVWGAPYDRMTYMAAMCGIVFDARGYATAYRSVSADMRGRFTRNFVQHLGKQSYPYEPAGSGTCVQGIHVSSAATAYTYFGIDPTARLIKVKFHRRQLLDCDGQKARISGGVFSEIQWPWHEKTRARRMEKSK